VLVIEYPFGWGCSCVFEMGFGHSSSLGCGFVFDLRPGLQCDSAKLLGLDCGFESSFELVSGSGSSLLTGIARVDHNEGIRGIDTLGRFSFVLLIDAKSSTHLTSVTWHAAPQGDQLRNQLNAFPWNTPFTSASVDATATNPETVSQ
jgi:hypothetical protein